jgi:hypothetical protein
MSHIVTIPISSLRPNPLNARTHSKDADSKIIFGEQAITIREIVETVVYGALAHANPGRARIFEEWEKSGIMGLIWAEFFAAMRSLMI